MEEQQTSFDLNTETKSKSNDTLIFKVSNNRVKQNQTHTNSVEELEKERDLF